MKKKCKSLYVATLCNPGLTVAIGSSTLKLSSSCIYNSACKLQHYLHPPGFLYFDSG